MLLHFMRVLGRLGRTMINVFRRLMPSRTMLSGAMLRRPAMLGRTMLCFRRRLMPDRAVPSISFGSVLSFRR